MVDISQLSKHLRPYYSRFLSHQEGRILLTAHSHQAWPNAARDGQIEAWDDAARWVDQKWGRIFSELLPEVQRRISTRLGSSRPENIAFAPNTHELTYRLLSCWSTHAKVLTTDGEFHSLARQLKRSEEDGLNVTRVPVDPINTFSARMIEGLQVHQPDLIALSHVFFGNAQIAPDLPQILTAAAEKNITVLVDSYHAYCVLPMSTDNWPGSVFVTGGSYKYAQGGEGVCFLLLPNDHSSYRPRYTGWMSDFESLETPSANIEYGSGGWRFFGSTFDPTPFYRAAHVLRWMDNMGLTPTVLRAASVESTEYILHLYDQLQLTRFGLELASPRSPNQRGGFIAFQHQNARKLCAELKKKGVFTDVRHNIIRLGPAPYTHNQEIERAMHTLSDCIKH